MNNDITFADGIYFYRPHEKAPKFVKGDVFIHPQRFIDFMRDHKSDLTEKGFLKLNLNISKKGEFYFKLDTYKKQAKVEPQTTSPGYKGEVINPEDIPF